MGPSPHTSGWSPAESHLLAHEVSPANAQGNVLLDPAGHQAVTCSILAAVTGQQAVGNTAWIYAVNNSPEYEVIPDHTIVACRVPVLESTNLVPSLQQVNVEQ